MLLEYLYVNKIIIEKIRNNDGGRRPHPQPLSLVRRGGIVNSIVVGVTSSGVALLKKSDAPKKQNPVVVALLKGMDCKLLFVRTLTKKYYSFPHSDM